MSPLPIRILPAPSPELRLLAIALAALTLAFAGLATAQTDDSTGLGTRGAATGGLGGGGQASSRPRNGTGCMSPVDRLVLQRQLRAFERRFGPLTSSGQSSLGGPPPLRRYPMGGNLDEDLFTTNFVDLNAAQGAWSDWRCQQQTYDGHDASDVDLRTFEEQDIGVPVFAVESGRVVAAVDGHPDRNTSWNGQPANFVSIDHGSGRIAHYFHLRRNSVAVTVGQRVDAGAQIGFAASSGNSTHPHLHFAVQEDGSVTEPFAGPCRAGASSWERQLDLATMASVRDHGVTRADMSVSPGYPNAWPRDRAIALSDRFVYLWNQTNNLPPNSTWRLRFRRPNGTVAYTGNGSFGNASRYSSSWWWWYFDIPDMHVISGRWQVELEYNGVQVATYEVQVAANPATVANRPPAPMTAAFDRIAPRTGEELYARVTSSMLDDDPDHDLVRYRYEWFVDGQPVRQIVSAGRADALASGSLTAGSNLVRCRITPNDGTVDGPATEIFTALRDPNWQVVLPGSPDPDLAPRLGITGIPSGNSTLRFQVAAAQPNVAGAWVIGGTLRPVPLLGVTLGPWPLYSALPLSVDAAGNWVLQVTLPASLPAAQPLFVQALLLDSRSSNGLSASPTVTATTR